MSETLVAELLGRDDGDDGHLAGELMLEGFVFGPGVDSVEDDALLAGGDEVFGLGDSLATDPILALGLTDHFAELPLGLRGDFDAALFHLAIENATEIDFGDAAVGEVVDHDGFAGAAHTDNGD